MSRASVRTRRILLGLLGLALALALGYVVMRAGPLAPSRVTVVQAAEGRLAPSLFGIGTVEARRSHVIGPIVAGRVRRVAVDVGDSVKAGQLLAEMDPVDLDERTAALDAAVARAGSAMAAADAQRRDAQARLTLSAANAKRYVALGQQDFISSGAVEARLQEQASAQALVSAADANLAAARQDQQRLQAERAGLRQQRDKVRLLAPSDGLVTHRDAEPGSTVVAGQPVLRLMVPSSLWVRVRLDQGRSTGLAAGLPATVTLRSDPGRTLAGQVARVEPVSDSVTEERVALVSLAQAPAGLTVGELAEVVLALPQTDQTVLLPNAALQRVQGELGVWTLDGGQLRFAPVRVGASSLDGQVQVLTGVAPGTAVVVHSDKRLSADSRIQVTDAVARPRP